MAHQTALFDLLQRRPLTRSEIELLDVDTDNIHWPDADTNSQTYNRAEKYAQMTNALLKQILLQMTKEKP